LTNVQAGLGKPVGDDIRIINKIESRKFKFIINTIMDEDEVNIEKAKALFSDKKKI
jgi:hypothetical protein